MDVDIYHYAVSNEIAKTLPQSLQMGVIIFCFDKRRSGKGKY